MSLSNTNGELRIKVDEFSKAVQEQLKIYSDEVVNAQKQAVDEVTKKALKILKENAPVGARKGKYKKSLKSRTESETLDKKVNVLYSDGQAGLTHLLENGHATVYKSGKYGDIRRTKAIPHFSVANEYIENNLPKQFEKKVK